MSNVDEQGFKVRTLVDGKTTADHLHRQARRCRYVNQAATRIVLTPRQDLAESFSSSSAEEKQALVKKVRGLLTGCLEEESLNSYVADERDLPAQHQR